MKKLINYIIKYGPYLNNFFGGPVYPLGIALVVGGIIGFIIAGLVYAIWMILGVFGLF
jgi:hypothetical protein